MTRWIESRNPEQLSKDAKKSLEKDLEKSIESFLQDIYLQEEYMISHSDHVNLGINVHRLPEEISLSAQTKISCFQYMLAKKAEKQTNSIINLTRALLILTAVLLFFTIVRIEIPIKSLQCTSQKYQKTNENNNNNNLTDKPDPLKQIKPLQGKKDSVIIKTNIIREITTQDKEKTNKP